MHGRFLLLFSILIPTVARAAYERPVWVTAKDYGAFHVVVSEEASPVEKFAAEEFRLLWKQTTGKELGQSSSPEGTVNVWIGLAGLPAQLQEWLEPEGLGDDGVLIRTRTKGETRKMTASHLILGGGKKRGALYAVYQFFEDAMGVRWLTPEVTHFPPEPAEDIREIEYRHVPPFHYRDTNYRSFIENPRFALAHRLNGNSTRIPEEWGGHTAYTRCGFGHTFHWFVSPEEYGATHPEYFSEIEGKRQTNPQATQLDLTHPEVLAITKRKVAEVLADSATHERVVSITQMDWPFWNESWSQKAIDELEGSPSGSLIRFVNEVARSIEKPFPRALIDTFAYTYTRHPPNTVKPRDNVIVRLCSIECDFARPFQDSTSKLNRAFRKDLQGWTKDTKNLWIWDYTQNWHAFQGPHPNFHVLQPNLRFLADNGVTGVFEQASPSSPHSDFEHLKGYILAHALWDPEVDWNLLYTEFLALYYQDAAPFIHEYIELITKQALAHSEPMTIFSKMDWMDYDTVMSAEGIFRKAYDAARDPLVRARVDSAYLPVQYSALVCPPKIEMATTCYRLRRPPSLTFDEYWERLRSLGVTYLNDSPIEEFRTRLEGKTPPRSEEIPIARLENENYELWVTPTLGGAVQRFRDKRSNIDLFKGFKNPVEGRWGWQEWTVMDPDSPVVEEPVAKIYEVVESSATRLTLRSRLSNGLVVTRVLGLPAGATVLDLTLEIRNEGASAVVPRVKVHPEFWTQGGYNPEVWVETDQGWEAVETERRAGEEVVTGRLELEGVLRWGFRVIGKGMVLVNTIRQEEISQLSYFHNRARDHFNLEVYPDQSLLEPGGTRALHAQYEVLERVPYQGPVTLYGLNRPKARQY